MSPVVRCSFFRVVLVALLLVALLQLLYLSLLSSLHGRQQQRSAYPVPVGTAHQEPRWQVEQRERLKDVLSSGGILDASGQYRIYRPLVAHEEGNWARRDVALASHASLSNMGHLQDLVERWEGRISFALFSANTAQTKLATLLVYALARLCQPVRQRVSFHLVCQSGDMATFPELEDRGEFARLRTCQSVFAKAVSMGAHSVNYAGNVSYPNNLLRNVARAGIGNVEFSLVVDIDMVPSERLRADFLALAAGGVERQVVFVVPAFEIRHTRRLPSNKEELLRLYQVGEVRAFYEELCPRCQAPTNYSRWINLSEKESSARLGVAYIVEWRDPWEPFYIGGAEVPAYDERFKQYGFNRISQACEMNMAGFSFAVLDSAFLLHKGHKLPGDFHSQKEVENRRNRQLFRGFKEELKIRYPNAQRHC
ncbi:beta-1,4-glucuronyltransferase 1 [Bombina bombina]|uniref:beta-1,4-glucuronyltransferase 1 n=1 Tax=Bombina bombina TaxID=8345 RepID=UPI00235B276E|nr:beta-1,4-glucuronyltransferase 1 [Bombina bombina]